MNRYFKLALLGTALLAVTACAAPNREPDLSNIQANVDKTYEGDFGELLYNLNQAGDKARTAEEIKASIDADAPYLYTNLPLRQEGVQLAEEAAEHRAKAEAALNRCLAYLESLHVPQDVGPQKTSVYFDTGSAKIRESEAAAMTDAGNFLSQYPIAHVQIDAYTDTVGSTNSNAALAKRRAKAVMDAMSDAGVPLAADVSVKAVGEAEGADNTESQENRRVDIIVQPHGTYNKGM
jgi:outer membrane protein OmpA-like peptidoglycan-associated protein